MNPKRQKQARLARKRARFEDPYMLAIDPRVPADQPNGIMTLYAHESEHSLYDCGGKLPTFIRRGVPYEKPLLEHVYSRQLTGTAVDVGAHQGNHTLWFSVVCGLNVVSFEPVWYEYLRRNVSLNPEAVSRVRIEPYALSDCEEQLGYHGKGKLRPEGELKFSSVTLDSYNLDDVCLIKIDVEGMEPAVIRGAHDTIVRCRPIIFAEQRKDIPGSGKNNAHELEALGYRMTHLYTGKEAGTPMGQWESV